MTIGARCNAHSPNPKSDRNQQGVEHQVACLVPKTAGKLRMELRNNLPRSNIVTLAFQFKYRPITSEQRLRCRGGCDDTQQVLDVLTTR